MREFSVKDPEAVERGKHGCRNFVVESLLLRGDNGEPGQHETARKLRELRAEA